MVQLILIENIFFFYLKYISFCLLSDYSVGNFFEDARHATKDVLKKGRVPIVTGGTGLYLRWYVYTSF